MEGCLKRLDGAYGTTRQVAELTLSPQLSLRSHFGTKRHFLTTPVRHLTVTGSTQPVSSGSTFESNPC